MGQFDNLKIWKDLEEKKPETEADTEVKMSRSHPDPTADIALSRVMREERRKKQRNDAKYAGGQGMKYGSKPKGKQNMRQNRGGKRGGSR